MPGVSTNDKSLFNARRVVAPISEGKTPEKKKSALKSLKRLLPIISFSFTKRLLPQALVSNKRRTIITTSVLGGIILVSGAFGYYEYLLSQNPAVIYSRKLKTITNTVSQQVSLPTDEQPVVATVTDTTKLPKEAFFQNAQNGDKILMYKKDKKAILYRPSTGKVITVATLDFEDVTPTPASAVAGASTSASTVQSISGLTSQATPTPASPSANYNYIPQGKILIQPQQ